MFNTQGIYFYFLDQYRYIPPSTADIMDYDNGDMMAYDNGDVMIYNSESLMSISHKNNNKKRGKKNVKSSTKRLGNSPRISS